MRIDYYHTGDSKTELITLDKIYQYGTWAGSLQKLIDNFNNGKYYAKIYDDKSGKLIFSKGFDTYFGEYQTSSKALDGIKKTYSESILIPSPKSKIKFVIERRDKQNKLQVIYSTEINPVDVNIIRKEFKEESVKIFKPAQNGDPHKKVDVVILGEGYTNKEVDKFKKDLNRFIGVFFNQEPYKSKKEKFNIYGVLKPSEENGVSEPTHNSFKNTALSCSFNSLGSERYLLTEDNKTMRNIAAHVPYDAIYIMVNHARYGGGGIYNLFCTFTTDNQYSSYVFLHEFGHSFSGLADEYYTSDVAYNDFYPQGVEPVEPNITALLDPKNIKWKKFLSAGIMIPTPWKKNEYDNNDLQWQRKRKILNSNIAELKRNHKDQSSLELAEKIYNQKDKQHADEMDSYLRSSEYWGKVGAFEGAGYASKGLYRPMIDCIMFSKGDKPFCKVCKNAINKVINYYSE